VLAAERSEIERLAVVFGDLELGDFFADVKRLIFFAGDGAEIELAASRIDGEPFRRLPVVGAAASRQPDAVMARRNVIDAEGTVRLR